MAERRKPAVIPLTLVVGPRGAGKTTLINRLLRHAAFAHSAVILNDFGAAALEASVVDTANDDIVSLGGGCVCCSVRGALTDGLERLLRDLDNGRIATIGRVVIEAAETAGPAAIVAALLSHPYLSLRFAIDGIVAVLGSDAASVLSARADIVHQVAIADVVAVRGGANVAIPNATALVVDATEASPALFVGHALDSATVDPAAWLRAFHPERAAGLAGEAAHVASFAVDRAESLSPATLDRFLEYLAALQAPRLIRLRAVVATGQTDLILVESYGSFFLPPLIVERADAASLGTRFVVAARDFDAATFQGYLDAFLNEARIDTPDRQALTASPLSIAGFSARRGR